MSFWPLRRRPVQSLTLRITVIVEQGGEEYHAYSPGLKGLHVFGASEADALENAQSPLSATLIRWESKESRFLLVRI